MLQTRKRMLQMRSHTFQMRSHMFQMGQRYPIGGNFIWHASDRRPAVAHQLPLLKLLSSLNTKVSRRQPAVLCAFGYSSEYRRTATGSDRIHVSTCRFIDDLGATSEAIQGTLHV
jgi:hypothetical protein